MKFLNSIDGASKVIQDANNRFVSDTEKTKLSNSNNSLVAILQPTTQIIGDVWFVEIDR